MDISCILLTWNSERYIEKCLNALLTELVSQPLSYEIFVVDNGSKDRTVALLRDFQTRFPNHLFPIYLDTNTGTTYSRNLALKQAKGRYLCIMDSDVEVDLGVIGKLIETVERDARIGLAAPKLLYPNGHLQKSTDVFPTIFTKFIRYFFLKQIEKREHRLAANVVRETEIREVEYAISAMWLLKREAFERVGLLDEKIFYSPEDVDYCLRIWKAGYSIVYNPTISCIHHTQEISRGLKINRMTVNHAMGLLYYFRKHRCMFRHPQVGKHDLKDV